MATALLKLTDVQLGTSVTATNNFTFYQPSTPDGTVRIGNGNSGSVTDIVTLNSSGNVGIGTSSPSSIAGYVIVSANGSTGALFEVMSAGTQYGRFVTSGTVTTLQASAVPLDIRSTGANYITATVNGAERMRIDSSGNLGLGVTPSAWTSNRKAMQFATAGSIFSTTANNQMNMASNMYLAAGGVTYLQSDYASLYTQYAGQHQFYTAPSGTAGNAITFTQAMTLDASGNLGIGTSSPATKLNLYGTSTQELRISTNTSGDVRFGADLQGAYYNWIDNYRSSGAMAFGTNNTERMRIDSSGNVGIGTSSPSGKLHVVNGSTVEARFSSPSNVYADLYLNTWALDRARIRAEAANPGAGSGTGSGALSFWVAQNPTMTEAMRIDSSGNLLVGKASTNFATAGTVIQPAGEVDMTRDSNPALLVNRTTNDGYLVLFYGQGTNRGGIAVSGSTIQYNSFSDYRLKDNVQSMTGALEKVAQLNPVTYTWKADGSDGQGFIAHELQAVVPDCVTGEKDAEDEDGNPVYQGIDTSFLVATLAAAIKEQQAIIESLTKRIETLEGA